MLWQLVGQVNGLMCTPLWHHHDTADFLYLRVIWRAGSIQITCNLQEKIYRYRTNSGIEYY